MFICWLHHKAARVAVVSYQTQCARCIYETCAYTYYMHVLHFFYLYNFLAVKDISAPKVNSVEIPPQVIKFCENTFVELFCTHTYKRQTIKQHPAPGYISAKGNDNENNNDVV